MQVENRRSNKETMKILKYMESEIEYLRKQEALEFAIPPNLRKFSVLLDLSNNEMEVKVLPQIIH